MDAITPLSPAQIDRIQHAVADVLRVGWGEVKVVIVKGRVVGIKIEISESLN